MVMHTRALERGLLLAWWLCACDAPRPEHTYVGSTDAGGGTFVGGTIDPGQPVGNGTSGAGGDSTTGANTTGGVSATSAGESPPADELAGAYAFRLVLGGELKADGQELSTQVVTYGLVEVTSAADVLAIAEHACFSQLLSSSSLVTLSIAPNVAQTLTLAPAMLAHDAASGSYRRSATRIALGWKPATDTDPLPATASDARMFDADGDGKPGVNVHVEIDALPVFGGGPCDVQSVYDVRVEYDFASRGGALVGSAVRDLGSKYGALALTGEGCPSSYSATLSGPHGIALVRLPAGSGAACSGHTLDGLAKLFEP